MSYCLRPKDNPLLRAYHDSEWCVPSFNDSYLFEMLILEGAQAGLSWHIVLSKREEYKKALRGFDIDFCAGISDNELLKIKEQYNVIKNMLKLKAIRGNARAVRAIKREFGSFSNYLWQFVGFKPIINNWVSDSQAPVRTAVSEKISADMKKRGFAFVGPVIVYSYMQAAGMVDDHIKTCLFHTYNRTGESEREEHHG